MSKVATPELKKYMDKHLFIQMNGNRKVTGILRGFDPFMNIVLEEAVCVDDNSPIGSVVIRGNSVIVLEALDRVDNR